MSTPSGLSDGTMMTIVCARIARVAASSPLTSRCASTSGVEDAAHLIGVDARRDEDDELPVLDERVALAADAGGAGPRAAAGSRGSAADSRSSAESEMIAAMNGRPSVVLPRVWSWMRGLDFASAVKYATTCDHAGSLRVGRPG